MPHDVTTEVAWQRAMLQALRTMAGQRDPAELARVIVELLLDHVGERAHCIYHDAESGTLWRAHDGREFTGSTGLVGHVVATGEALCLARAADPRRHAELDDPEGDGRSQLLLQPVGEPGGDVQAVLVAARPGGAPPFDTDTRRRIAELARRTAPLLEQLALQLRLDADDAPTVVGVAVDPGLYRAEAVALYSGAGRRGEVVRLESAALTWSYRLLVLLLLAGLAYVALVEIGDYADGPALVRLGGRTEVSAVESGSVAAVLVRPDEPVRAGQPLVRLHDAEDAAELRRLHHAFEFQLRALLRDPEDPDARRAVADLRAEQERAEHRDGDHILRAPRDGVVRDVRARVGQALAPGDVVLALAGEDPAPRVLVLLPGDERPRLRVGMPLRFEIDGYADATQTLTVERVHDDVIGPGEAMRLLGPAVGEGLVLPGPVVLIEARLPATTFASKGHTYDHHDGMRGRAEVRVRTVTILEALIPALERL
jgi:biotin carboxyl carrier protein